MDIDERIKEQNVLRNAILENIKELKTQVNGIAAKIRKLETIRRHAEEILGDGNVKITKADEQAAPFIDPAQLDIEDDEYVKEAKEKITDFVRGVIERPGSIQVAGKTSYKEVIEALDAKPDDGISEVEYEEEPVTETIVEPTPTIVRKKRPKPEAQVITKPEDFKVRVAPEGSEAAETKDAQADNDISLADY
jgi:hypothetical protein